MKEDDVRKYAWIFLQDFLPSIVETLDIRSFREYMNIVLYSSMIFTKCDYGRCQLSNDILISYDFYKEDIINYFNELGGYDE